MNTETRELIGLVKGMASNMTDDSLEKHIGFLSNMFSYNEMRYLFKSFPFAVEKLGTKEFEKSILFYTGRLDLKGVDFFELLSKAEDLFFCPVFQHHVLTLFHTLGLRGESMSTFITPMFVKELLIIEFVDCFWFLNRELGFTVPMIRNLLESEVVVERLPVPEFQQSLRTLVDLFGCERVCEIVNDDVASRMLCKTFFRLLLKIFGEKEKVGKLCRRFPKNRKPKWKPTRSSPFFFN